jgi:hypothetical protein
MGTARDMLVEHVLETNFKYDWCPDQAEPSYSRTIGAMLSTVGKPTLSKTGKGKGKGKTPEKDSCDSTIQDPDQIIWMRRAMEDAMDWMFQFGMCPFRMVIDGAMQPRIIIPLFESGNFIVRMSEVGELEVAWHTYSNGVQKHGEIQPDAHVGVYVWSKYKPMLGERSPFTSLVARIRRDYLRVQAMWKNMQHADAMNAYAPLVTRSTDNPRDANNMTWDEALGDSLAFDPTSQSIEEGERSRMDSAEMHRSSVLRNQVSMNNMDTQGPATMRVMRDGTEVMEVSTNPWFSAEFPLTHGRTPVSYNVPKPRTDILAMEDWLEKRVANVMRVPFESLRKGSSGVKSSTEAETSDRLFRGAVKTLRNAVTEFVEEAWAQGMGKIEEEIIIGGLDRLLAERERRVETSNDEIKTKVEEGKSNADKSKRRSTFNGEQVPPFDPPNTGKSVKEGIVESEIANAVERESDKIIRRAQSLHVPIEPVSVYKDVKALAERAGRRPFQTVNSEYLDVEDELQRQKGDYDGNNADLDMEEVLLKRALAQRMRLKVFWILPPVLDTGDIVFLHREGAISDEVRNGILFSKLDLPLDTPKGEVASERMLRIKAELDMEMAKLKHKFEMENKEQQSKLDEKRMEKQIRMMPEQNAGAGPTQTQTKEASGSNAMPKGKDGGSSKPEKPKPKKAKRSRAQPEANKVKDASETGVSKSDRQPNPSKKSRKEQ